MLERLVVALIRAYQASLGALFGGRCRFYPSCSEYAIEAVRVHGAARGALLGLRRLGRCGPWTAGGIDLPPAAHTGVSVRG